MSEGPIPGQIAVRLRALLPTDWIGAAGHRFRRTLRGISSYTSRSIRPEERASEAPDLAWTAVRGAANEKQSRALVNFAQEQQTKISSDLALRTSDDKVRQEKAIADRLESEARLAQVREMEARIGLVDKLRSLGLAPIWDTSGAMILVRVGQDYDWEALTSRLIAAGDLNLIGTAPLDDTTTSA